MLDLIRNIIAVQMLNPIRFGLILVCGVIIYGLLQWIIALLLPLIFLAGLGLIIYGLGKKLFGSNNHSSMQ